MKEYEIEGKLWEIYAGENNAIYDIMNEFNKLYEQKEELDYCVNKLKEKIEQLEEDMRENYRRIDDYEFYGVSKDDF